MSRPKVTVLKTLRRELPRNKRLLLAVSGGIDSVVLLHGCKRLARELGLEFEVAHIDHGLRKSSPQDAQFVAGLAKEAGFPFHLKQLQRPKGKVNLEAWGRQERFQFFAEVMSTRQLALVLTAHSASDAAETFLMKLVSNKELSPIIKLDSKRSVLRPLLGVTRTEIASYAKQHQLDFHEDETNRDEGFLRNRVRAKILPLLGKEFDPRITETLAERAVAVGEDLDGLAALAEKEVGKLEGSQFGSKAWLRRFREILEKTPAALQWRMVEAVLAERINAPLGRRQATKIVDFFLGQAEGVQLPGKITMRRKKSGIVLMP